MMCDQFYAIMCNNVGFLVVLMKIIIIMTGNNEGGERNEQTALTLTAKSYFLYVQVHEGLLGLRGSC